MSAGWQCVALVCAWVSGFGIGVGLTIGLARRTLREEESDEAK